MRDWAYKYNTKISHFCSKNIFSEIENVSEMWKFKHIFKLRIDVSLLNDFQTFFFLWMVYCENYRQGSCRRKVLTVWSKPLGAVHWNDQNVPTSYVVGKMYFHKRYFSCHKHHFLKHIKQIKFSDCMNDLHILVTLAAIAHANFDHFVKALFLQDHW